MVTPIISDSKQLSAKEEIDERMEIKSKKIEEKRWWYERVWTKIEEPLHLYEELKKDFCEIALRTISEMILKQATAIQLIEPKTATLLRISRKKKAGKETISIR